MKRCEECGVEDRMIEGWWDHDPDCSEWREGVLDENDRLARENARLTSERGMLVVR